MKVELEIVTFDLEDVITASGDPCECDTCEKFDIGDVLD